MELTDDLKKFKAFNRYKFLNFDEDFQFHGIFLVQVFWNYYFFFSVRQARAVARLWGIRAKKAKEAEADDLSKPGKK